MKKILLAAVAAACIWIITAPLFHRDSRPMHEKIADYMFHAEFDPRWEHLTERYGKDDFTVGEAGGIYSERFGTWVNLFWNPEEKTYQDNYIVYLCQKELIALLDDAFGDVFGNDAYRIYVLPYTFCPPSFDRNTEALELLEISALTDTIPVQTAVFTAKDPAGRDADWQEIQEAVQSRGWSLHICMMYVPEENLARIPENATGNPYGGQTVLQSDFYYYRANASIRPDSFDWLFNDGWREGTAEETAE